jgi:hypothetical protein
MAGPAQVPYDPLGRRRRAVPSAGAVAMLNGGEPADDWSC